MTAREEFEKYVALKYGDAYENLLGLRDDGEYRNGLMRDIWPAWQAARATAEQSEPSVIREIWMAEVCQDEDGFKHIESVVEDLDDFAAGTRLYILDGSKKHDLIDDDLIAKLAHEVSTECLAVPGVNFYMAAEMAIELTIETLGALKSQQDAAVESKPVEQPDTQRLDFMLANTAFTVACNRDGSILQYQLMMQDEDEEYHVLHNERRFYNTEREAIDAAIESQRSGDGS